MELMAQSRRKKLDINGATVEICEMPMLEFFEFLQFSEKAGSDAENACKLAEKIEKMTVKGEIKRISAKDINYIISEIIALNMAENCVIFPKNEKKTDKTELKHIDGAYLPIVDFVASEYGMNPMAILKTYTIRQLLTFFALIYNRKSGKEAEKIAISGMAQEVKSLPISEQKRYYEELYRQSLAL